MTCSDPAAYLASLPEAVQEPLVAIVRALAGMSATEKQSARQSLATLGQIDMTFGHEPEEIAGLLLIAQVGLLLDQTIELAEGKAA